MSPCWLLFTNTVTSSAKSGNVLQFVAVTLLRKHTDVQSLTLRTDGRSSQSEACTRRRAARYRAVCILNSTTAAGRYLFVLLKPNCSLWSNISFVCLKFISKQQQQFRVSLIKSSYFPLSLCLNWSVDPQPLSNNSQPISRRWQALNSGSHVVNWKCAWVHHEFIQTCRRIQTVDHDGFVASMWNVQF